MTIFQALEENLKWNEMPIHLIFCASEYSRIKLRCMPRVGQPGEPVAELTALGRTIMSPEQESDYNSKFFCKIQYKRFRPILLLGCFRNHG